MKKYTLTHLIVLAAFCFGTALHVKAQGSSQLPGSGSVVDVTPIVGDYTGKLLYDDGDVMDEKNNINVTKATEGKIRLHIDSLFIFGIGIDNIEVAAVAVTLTDKTYRFESGYVDYVKDDPDLSFEIKLKFAGTIIGNDMTIDIMVFVGGIGTEKVRRPDELSKFVGGKISSNTRHLLPDNMQMQVSGKTVSVKGFSGLLQVYDTSGVLVYGQDVKDATDFSLKSGIYIVKVGGEAIKVSIK